MRARVLTRFQSRRSGERVRRRRRAAAVATSVIASDVMSRPEGAPPRRRPCWSPHRAPRARRRRPARPSRTQRAPRARGARPRARNGRWRGWWRAYRRGPQGGGYLAARQGARARLLPGATEVAIAGVVEREVAILVLAVGRRALREVADLVSDAARLEEVRALRAPARRSPRDRDRRARGGQAGDARASRRCGACCSSRVEVGRPPAPRCEGLLQGDPGSRREARDDRHGSRRSIILPDQLKISEPREIS